MASIKVLPYGTGSGGSVVRFLLKPLDGQGREIDQLEILAGDGLLTAALIDSLPQVQRYTSVLISWHADDMVTTEKMRKCLGEFMELARHGLGDDRLYYFSVRRNNCLHIILVKVDLLTGKSFNPMPPGWQSSFGALRDAWNYENDWARPQDPGRARTMQPGRIPLVENDPRSQLTLVVEDALLAGEIKDQKDVMRVLSTLGETQILGEDLMAVKLDEVHRPIRLKGPLFSRNLRVETMREIIQRTRTARAGGSDTDGGCAARGCGIDDALAQGLALEARERAAAATRRMRKYVLERFPDERLLLE